MIKDKIAELLNRKLNRKKHEVVKLQWEKAELERLLKELKAKNEGKDKGDKGY